MGVGIGLGCAEFPFTGAAAYWRWIDMCEAGGVDSIWQTDRIVGRQPFLESMTTMAAVGGRPRPQTVGIDTRTRGRKADECLDIISRLWREESVDFDGAFYKLKGVTIAPKPVQ